MDWRKIDKVDPHLKSNIWTKAMVKILYINKLQFIKINIYIKMTNYIQEIVFDAHQNDWKIRDTKQNRKKVISEMGKRFKEFKSDLVRNYMKKNSNPCGEKENISQAVWEEFCAQRTSPEWLVQFI